MDTTEVEESSSSCDEASIVESDLEKQATQTPPNHATHPTQKHGPARMPWYGTTMLLVSDVLGTGVLSLPYAAATLGWVTTMIAIPLFACASVYSGYLLATIKAKHPEFKSFADASTELVSPFFGHFTRACMFMYWGALGIYYIVAAADGIEAMHGTGCSINRTILAAIILIIPSQCRDFNSISKFLSLPLMLCVLTASCIMIATIIVESRDEGSAFGADTTLSPSHDTNSFEILQALSTLLFAYEGQSIFLEIMSEMKDSRQFPKSNAVAMTATCILYASLVLFAYGFEGDAVPGFLPEILEPGVAKTAVGVLLVMQITVAYAVACQPVHAGIYSILGKGRDLTSKVSLSWLLVTCAFVSFGWFTANLLPFFADLQGLIGSIFGAATMFLWPPLLFFFHHRREAGGSRAAFVRMGWRHALGSCVFLFVLAPTFLVVGTTGSILSIVRNAKSAGTPFACG